MAFTISFLRPLPVRVTEILGDEEDGIKPFSNNRSTSSWTVPSSRGRVLALCSFIALTSLWFSSLRYSPSSIVTRRILSPNESRNVAMTPAEGKNLSASPSGLVNGRRTMAASDDDQGETPLTTDTAFHAPAKSGTNNEEDIQGQQCNASLPREFSLLEPPTTAPSILQDYVKWHQKQRRCLLDPSCKEKPRVLVSTCLTTKVCLGLGDRMRGTYFSFLLAVATKRVFFIHWTSNPFPLHVGMVPAAIDWTLPETLPFQSDWPYLDWGGSCKPPRRCDGSSFHWTTMPGVNEKGDDIHLWEDDVEKLWRNFSVITIETRMKDKRCDYLSKNPHFDEKFGTLMNTTSSRMAFRNPAMQSLFRPSNATLEKMSFASFDEDTNYYSVHLRTGDDVGEADVQRFSSVLTDKQEVAKKVIDCIERLRVNASAPKEVFLATDSSAVRGWFRKEAERKGYRVNSFNSQTMHVAKENKMNYTSAAVSDSDKQRELCDGFLAIFADIFMLAGADLMIALPSHFAMMAGMLNKGGRVLRLNMKLPIDKQCFLR